MRLYDKLIALLERSHISDPTDIFKPVDVTVTLPTVFAGIFSFPFVIICLFVFYFSNPAYINLVFCCQASYLLNTLANFPPQ